MARKRVQKSEDLKVLASAISRMAISSRLGKTYDSDRDLYTALGYKRNPTVRDFFEMYRFTGVGKRVVEAYPAYSWLGGVELTSPKGASSALSKKWMKLCEDTKALTYLQRADTMSGIGAYGILLLGVDDGLPLDQPLTSATAITYFGVYTEISARIETFNTDPSNPRNGLPEYYQIQVSDNYSARVHYSRVIHLAEGLTEDDVYGTPRLRAVFNYVNNVELTTGGASEMYWRGAFPGMSIEADPEAAFDEDGRSALNAQLEDYVHKLRRYLTTQGVEVKQLAPTAVDPTPYLQAQYTAISAATSIPNRILTGSERGQLASEQDEKNWVNAVTARREQYLTPMVLRPFITRLQEIGILPPGKYNIKYADLMTMDDKTRSQIGDNLTRSLYNYLRAPGAHIALPIGAFLKHVWGMTEDDVAAAGVDMGALNAFMEKMYTQKTNTPTTDGASGSGDIDTKDDESTSQVEGVQ